MITVGIVGSRKWKDKIKIIEVLHRLIQHYGEEQIKVVSGGARGADTLGKEAALQLGLSYLEYNPAHTKWNKYSDKPKEWYEKPYNVGNFFERNTFIAKDSDVVFGFIPEGHQSNGTEDTLRKAVKMNKPTYVVNEKTITKR